MDLQRYNISASAKANLGDKKGYIRVMNVQNVMHELQMIRSQRHIDDRPPLSLDSCSITAVV